MKNLTLLLIATIFLIFAGCKSDPVEQGSIKLDKTSASMEYDQEITLMPTLTGTAKNENLIWSSSNEVIAVVEEGSGGVGKVKAKRTGEAEITLTSQKTPNLSAKCLINVTPKSNIMGPVFFEFGATRSVIEGREVGDFIASESSETVLVYNQTPTSVRKVTKIIYQLDANKKLKSTLAIVPHTPENLASMEQFLKERYDKSGITRDYITYYNAGNPGAGSPAYTTGTMVGIFLSTATLGDGLNFDLGVKYTHESFLK